MFGVGVKYNIGLYKFIFYLVALMYVNMVKIEEVQFFIEDFCLFFK